VKRYAQRGDDRAAMGVFHPHRLAISLDKQRAMVQRLQRHLRVAIGQAQIREIGCGLGDNLLQLLWGDAVPLFRSHLVAWIGKPL
jgi:hypothetical protein